MVDTVHTEGVDTNTRKQRGASPVVLLRALPPEQVHGVVLSLRQVYFGSDFEDPVYLLWRKVLFLGIPSVAC